ncbi:MAG: serine/threonine-protein kinase [Minicystis sp.]
MHHRVESCTRCGAALDGGSQCAACGTAQPDDPYLGKTLGNRYEIHELIGLGGMGRVYRATHLGLDRTVAVKLIHPKHLTNQSAAARFMVEARAVSRLNHPNVVAIHDFGGGAPGEGPELYLVMELLAGESLGSLLHDGPMAIPRVVEILCQILAGLHEAHRNGVIHRDIKPENVNVEPVRPGLDRVKVIDFGVAKLNASAQVSQFGEVVGTPRYMAPEQASGRPASPATDIYAVGVLMFEMLTGKRLFEGRIAYEIVARILSDERPDPRVVAPERGIPVALAQLCLRAIAVDPAVRPPSAEAFARSILEAMESPWSPKHSLLFVACAPLRSGAARRSSSPAPSPVIVTREDATTQAKPARRLPAITPTPAPTPFSLRVPPSLRMPVLADPLQSPTIRMKRVTLPTPPAEVRAPAVVDEDSAILRMAEAFQAARHEVLGGELHAEHTWVPAGRRLGSALLDAGRVDEAYGVLSEILENTDPRTMERALVAEQLAYVAARRGRSDEARALLLKALEVAEALDDEAVSTRIRRLTDARGSGVRAAQQPSSRRKTGGGHRGK